MLVVAGNSSARAQLSVVKDLGCKLDDYTFDNGPILNAVFERLGKAGRMEINQELYFPGGALVFSTPLVLPAKTGVSLRGNGITFGLPEQSYEGVQGGPASRLVYTGPPDKPAITYRGYGLKLDGITLQRGKQAFPPSEPKHDGSVGLEIQGYGNLPTGKIFAPVFAVSGFDVGIRCSPEPHENNADESLFGFLYAENCQTVFRSDNQQCTGFQFLRVKVNGWCETVFDYRRGGDLVCDFLSLNAKSLVLRIRDIDGNTCNYEIRTLKVDNNSAGWRLVEMEKPGPLRLRIGGTLGKRATPGENPIVLLGDPAIRDVVIDLFQNGKRWP